MTRNHHDVNAQEIILRLRALASHENVAGMARFGIVTKEAFGVPGPQLKLIARELKSKLNDPHALACDLWNTGIHEARIIAYLIDDPKLVTPEQMDRWAADFDNWAICDSTCGRLFSHTSFAYEKAFEWSERDELFVKRAGIVLAAWLAVHDKKAGDEAIALFLPMLERHAGDERDLIRKAVSWSLRQIGKRNLQLNALAIQTAERIKAQDTKSAWWIASSVSRELTSKKLLARLRAQKVK